MRFLKFLAAALVLAMGLSSCNPKDNHDHSSDLVGTWTCLTADFAEAMVINEDGSVVSTILVEGNYLENVTGNIVVENDNVTLSFEDGTKVEGHFDIIPGVAFSIENENVGRMTFNYCKEDFSEEIVGMWVCTDSHNDAQNNMLIQTFNDKGKTYLTGYLPVGDNPEYVLNDEADYMIAGDLMFLAAPAHIVGGDKPKYIAERLIYTPKATSLGDVMTFTNYSGENNELLSESWLRIKEYLELPGSRYDYSNVYVTNVKAMDVEFEFAGQTVNLSNLDGSIMDNLMNHILFNLSFPSSDVIVYKCYYNGESVSMPAPIVVEGNKITIKKSANNPVYKDIDVWAFQDQDNTQMHMYMPTYAFENFLANTAVEIMTSNGELDLDDTETVSAIYNGVANAIETINVSFIFKNKK